MSMRLEQCLVFCFSSAFVIFSILNTYSCIIQIFKDRKVIIYLLDKIESLYIAGKENKLS